MSDTYYISIWYYMNAGREIQLSIYVLAWDKSLAKDVRNATAMKVAKKEITCAENV